MRPSTLEPTGLPTPSPTPAPVETTYLSVYVQLQGAVDPQDLASLGTVLSSLLQEQYSARVFEFIDHVAVVLYDALSRRKLEDTEILRITVVNRAGPAVVAQAAANAIVALFEDGAVHGALPSLPEAHVLHCPAKVTPGLTCTPTAVPTVPPVPLRSSLRPSAAPRQLPSFLPSIEPTTAPSDTPLPSRAPLNSTLTPILVVHSDRAVVTSISAVASETGDSKTQPTTIIVFAVVGIGIAGLLTVILVLWNRNKQPSSQPGTGGGVVAKAGPQAGPCSTPEAQRVAVRPEQKAVEAGACPALADDDAEGLADGASSVNSGGGDFREPWSASHFRAATSEAGDATAEARRRRRRTELGRTSDLGSDDGQSDRASIEARMSYMDELLETRQCGSAPPFFVVPAPPPPQPQPMLRRPRHAAPRSVSQEIVPPSLQYRSTSPPPPPQVASWQQPGSSSLSRWRARPTLRGSGSSIGSASPRQAQGTSSPQQPPMPTSAAVGHNSAAVDPTAQASAQATPCSSELDFIARAAPSGRAMYGADAHAHHRIQSYLFERLQEMDHDLRCAGSTADRRDARRQGAGPHQGTPRPAASPRHHSIRGDILDELRLGRGTSLSQSPGFDGGPYPHSPKQGAHNPRPDAGVYLGPPRGRELEDLLKMDELLEGYGPSSLRSLAGESAVTVASSDDLAWI